MANNQQQNSVFGISVGLLPDGGPKVLNVPVDLTQGPASIDFIFEIENDLIDFIQTVFVDNSANATALVLLISVTGHRIVVPPQSQGVFSVLMVPGGSRIDMSGPAAKFTLLFSNMPFAPSVWKTI